MGKNILDGYLHIDITNHPHVDIVHDIAHLSDLFDEGEVDEIYACHVLEHFSRHEVENVLRDWHHVLRVGGSLRIAVPDFGSVVDHYNEFHNLPQFMGLLYGGQTDPYNFHYVTFDCSTLSRLLDTIGWRDIQRYGATFSCHPISTTTAKRTSPIWIPMAALCP